ncbi:hypothetical protein PAPYR_6354 [Paratrimastix pyriformis]|uniref:Uncharacterized protein n=1 Tax=Paratrimastix pyriformis TaxID=342808 RepID=A0ABQ8UFN8_9EUKA|nr:hypothetical protein PAPYR_6354 [Paratrimastix pyriformis]
MELNNPFLQIAQATAQAAVQATAQQEAGDLEKILRKLTETRGELDLAHPHVDRQLRNHPLPLLKMSPIASRNVGCDEARIAQVVQGQPIVLQAPKASTLFNQALNGQLELSVRQPVDPLPLDANYEEFYLRVNDDFERLCAILCEASYQENKEEMLREAGALLARVPNQFQLSDFDGDVHWHPDDYAFFTVIKDPMSLKKIGLCVFRGTVPLRDSGSLGYTINDYMADLVLPFGVDTHRVHDTKSWMADVIKEHDGVDFVFFTGHSLGGYIAETMSLEFAKQDRPCAAVLFNAPGPHAFLSLFNLAISWLSRLRGPTKTPYTRHHRTPRDPVSLSVSDDPRQPMS